MLLPLVMGICSIGQIGSPVDRKCRRGIVMGGVHQSVGGERGVVRSVGLGVLAMIKTIVLIIFM